MSQYERFGFVSRLVGVLPEFCFVEVLLTYYKVNAADIWFFSSNITIFRFIFQVS